MRKIRLAAQERRAYLVAPAVQPGRFSQVRRGVELGRDGRGAPVVDSRGLGSGSWGDLPTNSLQRR